VGVGCRPCRPGNAPGRIGAGAGSCRRSLRSFKKKKKKKKKKKILLPLLLYHTLPPKVKYFLKNFLKKISRFLLTFASGYDIIEERVQIKKNIGDASPPYPPTFYYTTGSWEKSSIFAKIF